MGLVFRKCVHNFHGQQEKNAFYLSVNAFSTKVLIGDIILAPTGDYPRYPGGGQLSRNNGGGQ